MANELIRHARAYSPWFIPNKGGTPDDLHGITNIGGAGASVDREDIFVVGRKTKCGTDQDTPESTVPITQLERGTIDGYLLLSNLSAEPAGGITLDDFSNSLVDVALYGRDSFNGVLESTVWFPKTAISTLGIDIADPEARIERSFDMEGDDELNLTDANKLLIHRTATSAVTGAFVITGAILDPTPIVDPNNAGIFILRVDQTRAGVTTTLKEVTDYTYDDILNTLTILASVTGDVYNVYYTAGDFGIPGDPTTPDNEAVCFLKAENVTVLIQDATSPQIEVDCLTSLSINATLNRIDESCLGSSERLLREISDTPVTIGLSGRVKKSQIQKALMNKLGTTHGIQSVKLYKDDVKVTVKIYSDATKTTFLLGYQVGNLAFDDSSLDVTANDFATLDINLGSDELLITAVEANL